MSFWKFDQVYLINLNRRPEQHEMMCRKLRGLGIKFKRMQAVDGNSMSVSAYMQKLKPEPRPEGAPILERAASLACTMSHINCIRDAQRRKYRSVLILEDDLLFHHDFIPLLESKSLPEWNVLYLGASQYNWDGVSFHDGYYLADQTYGRFAYGITANMYDELVDTWMGWGTTGDGYMAHVIQPRHPGKCLVLYPNLCVADVTSSDIRGPRSQEAQARKFRWNMELYR